MEVKILEIPGVIYRRAKSASVQRGIPLRAFVTQALMEKLDDLFVCQAPYHFAKRA
jgi:hypothetical protein